MAKLEQIEKKASGAEIAQKSAEAKVADLTREVAELDRKVSGCGESEEGCGHAGSTEANCQASDGFS